MATDELVIEHFQFFGIDVKGQVLAKCVDLCDEYEIDPETFVDQWMAFSLSNLNGAPPNIDSLNLLERKEFTKDGDHCIVSEKKTTRDLTGVPLPDYSASSEVQPDNDVLLNYMSTTPKRPKVEGSLTTHSSVEFSPATYSPSITHSGKYASRTNAGSVLLTYGEEAVLQNIDKPCDISNVLNLTITQVPNEDGELCTSKAMFGFELLHEKASTVDNHIRYLSECIMRKAGITQTSSVKSKSQTELFVVGRIECDADARLNPKSVVLQGTWEESLSQAVPLDIDQLKQYSLFPGQVVAVRGTNPRGDKFIAQQIYSEALLPIPDHKADLMNTFQGTMSMVIVSGPYTTSDSMLYEPFKDLVSYVIKYKPHILIMTGPFMDSDHTMVKDNTMAETYRSFFEKLVDNIAEISSGSPQTKVIIVSNLKDAFHVNIYPTPPYACKKKLPNIKFVPDPCTLNINGVIIGITSSDILMHLSQEEISLGAGGDKLARLAGLVMAQQCYYPLWPPPTAQPLDAALWAAHAQLPHTPHVLVLPSNFRYFVKEVNGCTVVNPEHLTKGTGGGTFARVQLKLDDKTTDFTKCIGAQIVRI